MNDFTQQELQILKTTVEESQGFGSIRVELMDKLQSMIDNYCEPKQIDGFARHPTDYTNCNHDWHELEFATKIVTPQIICSKCRALHFIRDKR